MIYRIIFFFFIATTVILPQNKYFIYFKDKGINPGSTLNKSSQLYQQAVEELSERAIERRIKNMGDEFITYEDLPLSDNYLTVIKDLGIEIIHELKWFNSVSVRMNDAQIEQIKSLSFVEKIVPVKSLTFQKKLVDDLNLYKYNSVNNYGPSFTQLELSDIPLVHSKGITGEDVIIGLLDTGYDWERHISLNTRNVIAEYDFIFNDNVTANQTGDHPSQHDHGTLIFSIIGGYHDSTMIGAAFNSSYLLAKTEDFRSETRIEEDNYAAALIWMEGLGVDITSSSLGYSIFDTPGESYTYSDMDGKTTIVTRAAELAFMRGVATFTSAGNEGNTSWFYITAPADGKNTIGVGAVNSSNQIAGFSSRGPSSDGRIKPEIVAMGVGVYGASASTDNGYRFASGTSTSAPIASGVAALLLSIHSHLKNTQIRSILLESADNSLNPNNDIGYGLISAKRAIEFPNLEFINNDYVIRKIFFQDNINPNSVKMHYSIDGTNFTEASPTVDRIFRFSFDVPYYSQGQDIQFYFTYSDSNNTPYREPAVKNYMMKYGSLYISLNLAIPVETDYIVSEPYPNPFLPVKHKSVRLNYKSSGNEIFKMAIIDGAGQKVKEFNEVSTQGVNVVEWNGYSDRGYLCASGVYYLLIQLGGKEYGRKLILLK
jgi:serine protease AprX